MWRPDRAVENKRRDFPPDEPPIKRKWFELAFAPWAISRAAFAVPSEMVQVGHAMFAVESSV